MKKVRKPAVDMGMAGLFLAQMAYPLFSDSLHEWLGIALFALFVLHNILNAKWYAGLRKGKYSPARALHTITNLLLAVSCLGLLVSGLLLSPTLSGWLHLRAALTGRKLHMVFSTWSFLLAAVHVGLHGNKMVISIEKKTKCHKIMRWIVTVAIIVVCAYGLINFFARGLWQRMFLLTDYISWDYTEPLFLCITGYLSIFSLFACTAYLK